MQTCFYPISKSCDAIPDEWSSFTAVVACVGVGNVSQLSCDLIIHNLHCKLFANLCFDYAPSVVGYNPYSSQQSLLKSEPNFELMTSSQLYVNKELRLAVIQMRSPPFPNCQKKHVEEVAQFLHSARFLRVILLSSSFAMQCKDAELLESRVRYAVTEGFSPSDREQLEAQGWPRLLPHPEDDALTGTPPAGVTYRLPGCGIASRLFDALGLPDRAIPVCLLNIFASEGDNADDALYVVQKVNSWLRLLPKENADERPHKVWLPPPSWAMLYGTNATQLLY